MALKGPFDYDPTFNSGGRCGAIRDGSGDWRITTVGCMYKGVHLYVTGFSSNPSPAQTAGNRHLLARIVDYLANENDYVINIDTAGNDGIDIMFPSNLISPADQQILYQLTMVFIGIRDYTPGQYPAQSGLFDDDFTFNAIQTTSDENKDLYSFLGGIPRSITAPLTVSNQNYHATTRQQTAHVFCGFIELNFVKDPTPPTTDFYGFRTTAFELEAPFQLTIESTRVDFQIVRVGMTCTMFTAIQPFCQQDNTRVALDGEPTFTADPANGQAVFSTAPFPSHVGQAYTGSAATAPLLAIQQTSQEITTFTYTLEYSGVMSNTGYEGLFHLIGIPGPPIGVRVVVFGTVIFDGIINMPVNANPAATSREFAFMHYGSSSTVVIAIRMPTFNTQEFTIQFGLDKHANLVLLPENECVSFCPARVGRSAGINGAANVPPACVYCRNDLFQVFDPITQACICAFGRANVNGVC